MSGAKNVTRISGDLRVLARYGPLDAVQALHQVAEAFAARGPGAVDGDELGVVDQRLGHGLGIVHGTTQSLKPCSRSRIRSSSALLMVSPCRAMPRLAQRVVRCQRSSAISGSQARPRQRRERAQAALPHHS